MKSFIVFLCLLFPVSAFSVEINALPPLGTATQTDKLVAFDSSATEGNRIAGLLFSNVVTENLNGQGGFSLPVPLGSTANDILQWSGSAWIAQGQIDGLIDDTAGNGDANSVWSADKIFDLLALKTASSFYAYSEITVADMKDGASAPAALDDASTRSPYAYRAFDGAADEDLNFVWFVPADLSGTTIQYRVYYYAITTISATDDVRFGLSGVSVANSEASNGSKGTEIYVLDENIDGSQHDIIITGWSENVTFTGIAAGEVAEVNIMRDADNALDTYTSDVGVFMIQIRYTQTPGS